jgi:hypothetical protein
MLLLAAHQPCEPGSCLQVDRIENNRESFPDYSAAQSEVAKQVVHYEQAAHVTLLKR